MPNPDSKLTGREWYDLFMAELLHDTSILTPMTIKVSRMAQKAAGLI